MSPCIYLINASYIASSSFMNNNIVSFWHFATNSPVVQLLVIERARFNCITLCGHALMRTHLLPIQGSLFQRLQGLLFRPRNNYKFPNAINNRKLTYLWGLLQRHGFALVVAFCMYCGLREIRQASRQYRHLSVQKSNTTSQTNFVYYTVKC